MSRRSWVAVLCLLVALAIAGCGGDDENQASTTAPTTPSASTKPESTKSGSAQTGSKKSGSKGSKESTSNESGSNAPGSNNSTAKESGKAEKPTKPATSGGTPGGDGRPVGTVPAGGGPTADERAVVRTVRAYLMAIAQGDGLQACAQLTPEGRRAVEREVARAAPETKGSPCESSIELYQSSYRSAADGVRVTDVSVVGDRARAVALQEAASLVKRDRTWLIARYGQ